MEELGQVDNLFAVQKAQKTEGQETLHSNVNNFDEDTPSRKSWNPFSISPAICD